MVGGLEFEDEPDYQFLRTTLKSAFIRERYQYDFVFDWTIEALCCDPSATKAYVGCGGAAAPAVWRSFGGRVGLVADPVQGELGRDRPFGARAHCFVVKHVLAVQRILAQDLPIWLGVARIGCQRHELPSNVDATLSFPFSSCCSGGCKPMVDVGPGWKTNKFICPQHRRPGSMKRRVFFRPGLKSLRAFLSGWLGGQVLVMPSVSSGLKLSLRGRGSTPSLSHLCFVARLPSTPQGSNFGGTWCPQSV